MIRKLVQSLLGSSRTPELLASTVTINLLALGSSLYSMHILNRYVTIGLAPTLITLTVGVLLAIWLESSMRRQRQKVLEHISQGFDREATNRLFDAMTQSRYEEFTAAPVPQRREALSAPSVLQQLTSSNNLGSVLDLPFALLFLICATLLYWPMGLLGLTICVLALLYGVFGERRQRASAENHAKANARSTQMGQFLLVAGEVVRGLPLVDLLRRRWGHVQAESLDTRRDGMRLQSNLQQSIASMGQLLNVAVYCVGAIAVVAGDLTTGALIGANILVSRAFAVCSRAAYLADPILRASRATDALKAIEGLERANTAGAAPGQLKGHLEMMDVAFSYPRQPVPLFERLHFELAPGKVLVLTGPNGSGKSTLIKLVMGLLSPVRGMFRVDRIELRQLSSAWWRSQVGYAPQEPVFFDGTLRENLLLDRDVSDEALISWIHELGLEQFLASDPDGLDRVVSSMDSQMAMGLRRRFILIRAVVANAPLVVLDDPTEGLDQAGKIAVAKLLNKLLEQGKTLVVASNEPFIVRAADLLVDLGSKPVPEVKVPEKQAAPASEAAALALNGPAGKPEAP